MRLKGDEEALGEPPRTTIDFSPHCFSCSDQPLRIIKAFKMACLTYRPSKVPYMNELLSRDTMILVQDKVLAKMRLNIQETEDLIKEVNASMTRYLAQSGVAQDESQMSATIADGALAPGVTDNDRKYVRAFKSELTQNDKEILNVLSTKDIFGEGIGNKEHNNGGAALGEPDLAGAAEDDQKIALNNDF